MSSAVDGRGHGGLAIDTACVEAALRGQHLTGLHAREAPDPLGQPDTSRPDEELEMLEDRAAAMTAEGLADERRCGGCRHQPARHPRIYD